MQKPNLKNTPKEVQEYIGYLEKNLSQFTDSPYLNSYLACWHTIENWNSQLQGKSIDIFNTEEKPKFEMAHKYLTEMKPYIEQLEYLRKLMTPEQQKELSEKIKMENVGLAEKLALKNGKPNN